jgi:hypothetical protein
MRKVIVPFLICLFVFCVISAPSASAKIISDQKGTVSISKTEVIDDDLFIGAQNVVIDGTVNGDVFVGAQTVKINGTVNGNVHAGANLLSVSGTINGVGAATVNIDKSTTIGGSVLAGTASLSLDAQVKRSVYAGAGSLTVGRDAKIGKDLYYGTGENQNSATISSSAQIAGSVHKSEIKAAQKKIDVNTARAQAAKGVRVFNAAFNFISFLGALLVGFLFLKFSKTQFIESAAIVRSSFWKSFSVGFLITISFVPGFIVLLMTVVGIPLAVLALIMVFLYGYLSKMVVGSALGGWISRRFNWSFSTYGEFVVGLVAIYLVKLIPVVGFLSGLVVFWAGLGALTLRLFTKPK